MNNKQTLPTCRCSLQAQTRIGVMGSASGKFDPKVIAKCRALGKAIAKQKCCLLTGACPGLPHETVLGAKSLGGTVIGISPAENLKDHVEMFQSPCKEYDFLIFTGLGLMGRELVNIRSSDIVIIVGGSSGTLGEFAIAYESGKLIGVLLGSGGISSEVKDLVRKMQKKTEAQIIYHRDPKKLVEKLLKRYQSGTYICTKDLIRE